MFTGSRSTAGMLIPAWLLCLVAVTLVAALCEEKFEWIDRLASAPAWAYAMVAIVLLLAVEMIGVTEKAVPFVYFQF
jgi:hypothetical protein